LSEMQRRYTSPELTLRVNNNTEVLEGLSISSD
jgi:hypothetical protein